MCIVCKVHISVASSAQEYFEGKAHGRSLPYILVMPSADIALIHALAKNVELQVMVWRLRKELRFERCQKLHAQRKRGLQRTSRALHKRVGMLGKQALRSLQLTAVRGLRCRAKAAMKYHRGGGGEQHDCDGLSEPQSQQVDTQALRQESKRIVMDSVSLMEESVHVTGGEGLSSRSSSEEDATCGDERNMWEELLQQWFPDEDKSSRSSND